MEKLSELVESFALFADWEDRYRYIIDLGQRVPEMDNALKVEANIVKGCTSQVWLYTSTKDGSRGKELHFVADSDAQIVKGLIYILMVAYNGKTRDEIQSIDIEDWFEKLGLTSHLSPNRRNGFFAMVARIKKEAAAL